VTQKQKLKGLIRQTKKIMQTMDLVERERAKAQLMSEKIPNVFDVVDAFGCNVFDEEMDDGKTIYLDLISEVENWIYTIDQQIEKLEEKGAVNG
jgi:endo-alpha-1,4-polygalactosaminidase (GH114 family)